MVPDVGDALDELADQCLHGSFRVCDGLPGGGRAFAQRARGWQSPAEGRGHEVESRDDEDEQLGAGEGDKGRTEQGESQGERDVHRQREEAVGREELVAWYERRDHGRFGRAEEGRHGRYEDHQQIEH